MAQEEFNIASLHVDEHVNKGYGDKTAIFYEDRRISYRELLDSINRVGNALIGLGLKHGNRVMISLSDSPELVSSFLGAIKLGAIPFVASPASNAEEFEHYLYDSRAEVAVINGQVKSKLDKFRHRLRFLKNELVVGESSYDDAVGNSSPLLEPFETYRDDIAYWVYTSGTTGRPKAAVHLHRDLFFSVLSYAKHVVRAAPEDVFYSTSKLSFSYGRVNSMHMPLMVGGSVFLDSEKPEPQKVLRNIDTLRVTLFFSVPTFYNSMVRYLESEIGPVGFSKLRLAVSAGEPLPATIYDRWTEATGVEILDGLGSSEAEYIFISSFPGRSTPGCSGELIPGWEAKLVDEDGKIVADPGKVGVLWIKSDSTAAFYWNRQEDSQTTFLGEWYNTRDMLYKDEKDYFYYVGRSDELFKVKGMWVSPSDVEDALLSHKAVAECAVVGRADERGLIKPNAYVVLKLGFAESEQLAGDIQSHAREKLAPYKVPARILFVSDIPKTVTGKLQRYKFRGTG